jgi:hypothetical protein
MEFVSTTDLGPLEAFEPSGSFTAIFFREGWRGREREGGGSSEWRKTK